MAPTQFRKDPECSVELTESVSEYLYDTTRMLHH